MTSIFIPSIQTNVDYSIGKNAKHNFEIIDSSDDNDIWFHVANESSSHIIAHIPADMKLNKKQLRQILTQGAVLCKSHSRYKSQKNIEIIYTHIKNIEKLQTPGSVNSKNTKSIVI